MCGIAGVVAFDEPLDRRLLERMGRAMEYRGPDQGGVFLEQLGTATVGLATRRLKILDLSPAGSQPMSNQHGDVWIAYNGEIYNHPALKRELLDAGHVYRSRSDTETLLHAYERYGLDVLPRLNGMFAFALYDRSRARVVLARDRMGIKPLYYWWDGVRLAFASELKLLLLCPWIKPEINQAALQFYLAVGYVPSPYSILAGVQKLLPGSSVVLDLDQRRIDERPYWTVPKLPETGSRGAGGADLLRRTRAVVTDAVHRQMISDVTVGSLLSGGVDSTLITALAQRHQERPLDTFAVGYEAPPGSTAPFDAACNDDFRYARRVSAQIGTRHHEVIVPSGPELVDLIPRIVYQLDEPHSETTAVAQHLITQRAREAGVIVVLTGDGGDELFAGYMWYTVARRLAIYEQIPFLPSVLPVLNRLPPNTAIGAKIQHLSARLHVPDVDKYRHFFNVPSRVERDRMLTPSARFEADPYLFEKTVGALLGQRGASYFPEKLAWVDLSWWIRDIFNHRLDRMSMLNSVEARVPLQDNEVVDFALSVPIERKMPWGRRKHLLLEAFADVLPLEVRRRRKQGFVGPYVYWLNGALRELTLDLLTGRTGHLTGFVEPAVARTLTEQYMFEGKGDPLVVWRLLMLEIWCQQYGVRRVESAPIAAAV